MARRGFNRAVSHRVVTSDCQSVGGFTDEYRARIKQCRAAARRREKRDKNKKRRAQANT